jgi:HPt (histidine-containing phosphotransfer) domain-containing protein
MWMTHCGWEKKGNMRDEIINEIVSGLKLPPVVAQKLLNQYLTTLPKDIANLKESIVRGDFPVAAKMAHSIKGASGNLRINKIFQLAGELEHVLKEAQEGTQEKAHAMFEELDGLVKQLI